MNGPKLMTVRELLAVVLVIAGLSSWGGPAAAAVDENTAKIHFVDVGKGDAILMEFSCGAVLVDTGKDPAPVMNYLAKFFASRPDLNNTLSLVILTHGHGDHVNGFVPIAEKYKVDRLVYNGRNTAEQYKVVDWVKQHPELKTYTVRSQDIARGGLTNKTIDPINCKGVDPVIKVLWGAVPVKPKNWKRKAFKDENNHSIVTRVDFGKSSVLLTGDLAKKGIKSLLNQQGATALHTDVFKIGHHGFSSGTTPELLEAVSPEVAVVSRVADRPLYGPDLELYQRTIQSSRKPVKIPVWERRQGAPATQEEHLDSDGNPDDWLSRKGVAEDAMLTKALYWTGLDGDVVVEMNASGKIEVKTSHPPHLP